MLTRRPLNIGSVRSGRTLAVAAALSLAALLPREARAQEVVRFAQFKVVTLLPFAYGVEKGYFKDEGIDLQLINVPGGPAAGAAVASGSADIAYAAPAPVINARVEKQPFRFFMGLEYEQFPDRLWGVMLASGRSGVKTFKDLAGKTMVVGPPGGLCEVAARDWLMKSGVPADQVKFLNNPFPQMQAMLEVGTADAACVAEPFVTSIRNSKVQPVELGQGYLAEEKRKYRIEGLFASEAWITTHGKTIAALKRGYIKATDELKGNITLVKDILTKDYRLPPNVVDKMASSFVVAPEPVAAEFQPIIDAMVRTGMLKADIKATDLVTPAN